MAPGKRALRKSVEPNPVPAEHEARLRIARQEIAEGVGRYVHALDQAQVLGAALVEAVGRAQPDLLPDCEAVVRATVRRSAQRKAGQVPHGEPWYDAILASTEREAFAALVRDRVAPGYAAVLEAMILQRAIIERLQPPTAPRSQRDEIAEVLRERGETKHAIARTLSGDSDHTGTAIESARRRLRRNWGDAPPPAALGSVEAFDSREDLRRWEDDWRRKALEVARAPSVFDKKKAVAERRKMRRERKKRDEMSER